MTYTGQTSNLEFSSEVVGPKTFLELREADYGEGFKMVKFSQLPYLFDGVAQEYGDFETHDALSDHMGKLMGMEVLDQSTISIRHRSCMNALCTGWMVGNTGSLLTERGFYVQDNPLMEGEDILMDEKELEKKLGAYEFRDVVFSDDKTVRFAKGPFERGEVIDMLARRNDRALLENAVGYTFQDPRITALFPSEDDLLTLGNLLLHTPRISYFDVPDTEMGVPKIPDFSFGMHIFSIHAHMPPEKSPKASHLFSRSFGIKER